MAQIINMPRKQMLGAIKRDPSLAILKLAKNSMYGRCNRSTSEIWDELRHCKIIDDSDPRRAELIEELKQ